MLNCKLCVCVVCVCVCGTGACNACGVGLSLTGFFLLVLFCALLCSSFERKTTLIGPIHNSDKLEVKTWTVPAVAPGAKQVYATSCTLGDVAELVGRSLTVHAGPDKSSPTVAMAVCGLANPSSCFEDSLKSSLKCGSAQPQTNTPVAPPGTTKASVGGRTSVVAAVLGIWGVAVIAACL